MKQDKLLAEVRDILFHEWDPLGGNEKPLCHDEYDSYAPTIARFLREGADESKIFAHLGQLQRVSLGLQKRDEARNLRVARQLLNLVKNS